MFSGYCPRCYGVDSFGSWHFYGIHHIGRWLDQCLDPSQKQFFNIHDYYWLAPGICTVCSPSCQWVVNLLVSVKHWPMGHCCPQYLSDNSPIVCVIIALDSQRYCSGEQCPTGQHLPLNICFIWFHWVRESVSACGKGSYHKVTVPYFITYIHCKVCKEDYPMIMRYKLLSVYSSVNSFTSASLKIRKILNSLLMGRFQIDVIRWQWSSEFRCSWKKNEST